jgi:putative transposase
MKKTYLDQKQKLAVLESADKIGVREAAKVAGVHYTTVYEWKRQLEAIGAENFVNYRPDYSGRGEKEISPEQEKAILDEWKRNPGYGPGQIRNQLRRQAITISIRTIRKIMTANGYQAPGKKRDKDAIKRFEAGRPLELAQMDVLEFYINKQKVYLILLLDDFSRFILGFRLLTETSSDAVRDVVFEAINRYGKIEELLTDRGFVFYSWRGINRFEKFLELEGIDHTHARPHHPQTMGKVEACNKRIKVELLTKQRFSSVGDAQTAVNDWVEQYNYHRSHQGIGGLLAPAERFHGRASQVLDKIEKSIDITRDNGIVSRRCLASLVMASDGGLEFCVMGRPITLYGGE